MQRHKVITLLLVIYALFMTLYFGTDLLKSGQSSRFYITAISEIAVITLTYFALRKRDNLRKNKRQN